MHRIRLREPWTADLDVESGAIVYTRKFHKPTGTEQQSISLKVSLIPHDGEPAASVVVFVNRTELRARDRTSHSIVFGLDGLNAFNFLELRIFGSIATIRPTADMTAIPTFGSFVIESVELQIE